MTNVVAGNLAPNFSLLTSQGVTYSLRNLMQQGPVVVAFFKVSCPVCQFTFPFLQRLHQSYPGAATVLGVSQDDARATDKFTQQYGVTFPVVLDEKNYPVSTAYGLTNVPTIFLVDPAAIIQTVCVGFNRADLEAIAAQLAARKQVPLTPLFHANEAIPAHRPG